MHAGYSQLQVTVKELMTVLKSTTKLSTLSKNILLSTAKKFYEFSYEQQLETANSLNKENPGIHIFYIEASEVE